MRPAADSSGTLSRSATGQMRSRRMAMASSWRSRSLSVKKQSSMSRRSGIAAPQRERPLDEVGDPRDIVEPEKPTAVRIGNMVGCDRQDGGVARRERVVAARGLPARLDLRMALALVAFHQD